MACLAGGGGGFVDVTGGQGRGGTIGSFGRQGVIDSVGSDTSDKLESSVLSESAINSLKFRI